MVTHAYLRNGRFKTGDLAIYIPEDSILPDWMIEEMELTGKLSGSAKNRVKAIRLRGTFSQGILYTSDHLDLIDNENYKPRGSNEFGLGQDASSFLGVKKYEPPVEEIPANMKAKVAGVAQGYPVSYDIENLKNHISAFADGEEVVFTEKIHGTLTQIGIANRQDDFESFKYGRYFVTSKGQGKKGILIDMKDKTNVYVSMAIKTELHVKLMVIQHEYKHIFGDNPILVAIGETAGPGVQDLTYTKEIEFRLFDLAYAKAPGQHNYVDFATLQKIAKDYDIPMVPVLYRGPYSRDVVKLHTSGKETISGQGKHIREGIVIKPVIERFTHHLGRTILKSVSEDYLLRKGNTTEFN